MYTSQECKNIYIILLSPFSLTAYVNHSRTSVSRFFVTHLIFNHRVFVYILYTSNIFFLVQVGHLLTYFFSHIISLKSSVTASTLNACPSAVFTCPHSLCIFQLVIVIVLNVPL